MRLTRRDALAALAATGVGAAGVAVGHDGAADAFGGAVDHLREGVDEAGETATLDDHDRETAVAVARVLYPSAVENVPEFVGAYLDGATARPGYAAGAAAAIAELDESAREWHGAAVVDLDASTRETLLREVGADTAEPDPEGSPAARVRYYLVDELLFALYASPTGGELVGIENPQGHPGGTRSYRRGPGGR